jgi:hypothetical protein
MNYGRNFKEIKDLLFICQNSNGMLLLSPLLLSFHILFSRVNPLDWSLLTMLKHYNDLDKEIDLERDRNNEKVDSYSVLYYHFHSDYLTGPLLKKYLVFIALCYFAVFLQTSNYLVENNSEMSSIFYFILSCLLFLHFFVFYFGIYLAFNHYRSFRSITYYIPPKIYQFLRRFFPTVLTLDNSDSLTVSQIGSISFFFNIVLFNTLYVFTFTDIILILIWFGFSFRNQMELEKLFQQTHSPYPSFRTMFKAFSVSVLLSCFVQFYYAYPIYFLITMFVIYKILYYVNYYQRNDAPSFRRILNTTYVDLSKFLGLVILGCFSAILLHTIIFDQLSLSNFIGSF